MSMPFIASVLDTLGPSRANIDVGCRILINAIAPEIGMGAPADALDRVRRMFKSILIAYQARTSDRKSVEDLIYHIFSLAAQRRFDDLAGLAIPGATG